jgi:hypothetical protein
MDVSFKCFGRRTAFGLFPDRALNERFACLTSLSLSALARFSPGRYGKKLVYKAVKIFVNFRGGTILLSGTGIPVARILSHIERTAFVLFPVARILVIMFLPLEFVSSLKINSNKSSRHVQKN